MVDCIRFVPRFVLAAVMLSCMTSCQNREPAVSSAAAQNPASPVETHVNPAAVTPEPAMNPEAAGDTQVTSDERVDPAPLLDADALKEGWISLFDGHSLFGWRHENDADWRVENGAIVVEKGEPGLLVTTTPFSDYELKVQFRSAAGTNSGIFLATQIEPGDVATDCYELNIAENDNPFPTGSLVNRKKVEGDWNGPDWQSYQVRVESGHVVVTLDGTPVMDYTDPKPIRRGHIGLQLNKGKVEFRDIQLKPLGLASAFNGKDLTGWNSYPDMKSDFSVTENGELNVKNGKGQLETTESYGDFVLQLECISHAPNLNSGIFFRCIPGEEMNGYESQIHNGTKGGDRTKPLDCGTGGIFRRQEARRVVANDLEWFYKTIIADGPHVAVWVNGYQVSDWIDTRPPDPNPRRGLRLEPGTIMIQGHDPTTNLSFRNIHIVELPKDE